MPRFVRPFFVKGSMEGVKTKIATGPKTSMGQMHLQIFMRNKGCVEKVLELEGICKGDKITLKIINVDKGDGSSAHDYEIIATR